VDGERGIARFDGLFTATFAIQAGLEDEREDAIRALLAASPVRFQVQREPGSATLLPDLSPVEFTLPDRPAERLLGALRDFVLSLGPEGEWRVESTLRVQEFAGGRVFEGVYVHEDLSGVTLTARERAALPGERPGVPRPGVAERAEGIARRWRWPLVGAAAILAVLVFLGFQSGFLGFGASGADGPAIDPGPLAGILEFTKVRGAGGQLTFHLRPGPEFARFPEVAASCDLSSGVFRVLLVKEKKASGPVLALDLRDLPSRAAKLGIAETLTLILPWNGAKFDEVLICR
jgi:hypothetical protein